MRHDRRLATHKHNPQDFRRDTLVVVPRPVGSPREVKGVQAQAVRAFLLGLRWGQDPDAVCGGELGDAGRIGRDGIGQSQVAGRFARGRDELVESAG